MLLSTDTNAPGTVGVALLVAVVAIGAIGVIIKWLEKM